MKVSSSPKGPTKKSAKPQKRQKATGVAAAIEHNHPPQSTNISSPVRGTSRRKPTRNPFIDDEAAGEDESDEGDQVDENGYERDDFIVGDDEDSDDGFEAIREAGSHRSRSRPTRPLGPPITRDKRVSEANLSEIHQFAISAYVDEAKKLDEKIRNEKGIRKPLFNEQNFREMAINWTTTIDEMLEIPGINIEQVERYGNKFIPVIRRFHAQYEDMMGRREERDIDPNHRNVIDVVDLVSDEEGDQSDANSPSTGEPSKYFVPENVRRFNEQKRQIQAEHAAKSRPTPYAEPKPKTKRFSGGNNFRAAGGSSARGRVGSGASRSSSKGKITKRKASGPSKRSSGGSAAARSGGGGGSGGPGNIMKQFARKGGGNVSGRGASGGGSGIMAMPT